MVSGPGTASGPRGPDRHAGAALWALAILLGSLSALGPLITGAIRYRISDEIIMSQLLGLDAVALALVAPLSVVAGVMAFRGHPAWPMAAIGPAVYVAYMVPQYVLGPDYLERDGNNETFFPLFLALFVLGLVIATRAWSAMDTSRVPGSRRNERLVRRVLLPTAAFVVFVRYVPLLADIMSGEPASEDYRAGPDFAWTITLLDLGIALPATVAALVGCARGTGWARRALYAVVPWYALVGVAVAAMAIAMELRDDPGSSVGGAVFLTVLGAALVAMAAVLFVPSARRAAAPGNREDPS